MRRRKSFFHVRKLSFFFFDVFLLFGRRRKINYDIDISFISRLLFTSIGSKNLRSWSLSVGRVESVLSIGKPLIEAISQEIDLFTAQLKSLKTFFQTQSDGYQKKFLERVSKPTKRIKSSLDSNVTQFVAVRKSLITEIESEKLLPTLLPRRESFFLYPRRRFRLFSSSSS